MKRFALPLAALVALAACDSSPDADVDDTVVVADSTTDAGAMPEPVPTATVTASPTPSPAPTVGTIPAAIQGRWGLVPADCTSTRGDAKGLLTIGGTTLKFYESLGTLTEVKEATGTRLRGSFAFSGEGMTWQRDETLDVQDGGQTLIRREYGDDAAPGPFKYAKCA